jgi:glycine hydroxymethyltransferase
VVVLGKSLFLFPEPIAEIKDVCDRYKIPILYDAAHVLGLIAGRQFQQPLQEGAAVVMASTHKTFYGPQRGLILSNLPNRSWKRIDKGAFPGSSSNHHLDTLPPLLIATCEMLAFGEEYAKQVVANAQALGAALDKHGFDVQMKEQGYTRSHQVAVDVSRQGGGSFVSSQLKESDIILNMNLLPNEPLSHHENPAGVRIGTQEMTRIGMKEAEMEHIAGLIAAVVLRHQDARAEVNRFREQFQDVHYSFDNARNDAPAVAEA